MTEIALGPWFAFEVPTKNIKYVVFISVKQIFLHCHYNGRKMRGVWVTWEYKFACFGSDKRMYYLLFKWCVVWYFLGLPPLSHSPARPQSAMQKVCDTSSICSHLFTEWSLPRTWTVPSIPMSYPKLKSGCSLQARKVKRAIFWSYLMYLDGHWLVPRYMYGHLYRSWSCRKVSAHDQF